MRDVSYFAVSFVDWFSRSGLVIENTSEHILLRGSIVLTHITFLAACTNGQIRLYDGAAAVTDNGTLQICKSGQWRAVCDYRWTQAHSIVVCKQLGYSNPSEFYT